MGIELAVAAGGMAIMGGLAASQAGKKSARTTTETTNQTPWQAAQLNAGFDHSRALFDDYQQRTPFAGPDTVGLNDPQREGVGQLLGAARVNGKYLENATAATAGTLLRQGNNFVGNANDLATNGAAPANATAAGVLTRAANGQLPMPTTATGAQGGAAMTGALNQTDALTARAGRDPAQAALTTGNDFANSDVVQQQIDNASLDVTRNFNENTAPGLNARASAGGNLNSARAGIAEGLARRDAGEAVGRIAADMRGNAFNQGVGASMEGNAQQNALALGANQQRGALGTSLADLGEGQRQFNAGTQMQGATTLGQQDTANRALEANTRLEGNQQLGQGVLSGFDAAQAAGGIADNNAQRLLTAGGIIQAEDQRLLDEQRAAYYRDYTYQRGLIDDHLGSVQGNYGQSVTQTSVAPAPNIMQGALGGAMMGAGAYGALRQPTSVGAGTFRKS